MKRLHWGRVWSYVGIAAGAVASIAGNVAHAYVRPEGASKDWHPEVGLVIAAGFAPVGLLIAVEVLTRIAWPKGPAWLLARFGGVGTVAAVVAVVSYQHLSSLLRHYKETSTAVAIYPLAVDGLMIVCSAALIALHVTATSGQVSPAAYQSSATDLYGLLGYSGLKNVTVDSPVAVTAPAGSGVTPPDARLVGAPPALSTAADTRTQVSQLEMPRLRSLPAAVTPRQADPVTPPLVTPEGWHQGMTGAQEVSWLARQLKRGCQLKDCRDTAGWSDSTAARRSRAVKGSPAADSTESDSEQEVARA